MRFRVMLEIRGFPAHAWSAATAQVILGDTCANPELTPTTSACADLRCFQTAVWCSDPDRIPNEAIIRIPEKLEDLGNNNLYLRPEEIIHHQLRLLCYKVEIEILEIHDWNESDSSDDHGTLPDRAIADSDSDEDYPGLTQHLHSGPWPRRAVFRTPGYGDVGCNTSDAGGSGAGGSGTGGANSGCNFALVIAETLPGSVRIHFGSFVYPDDVHGRAGLSDCQLFGYGTCDFCP
ncbi:hypothetical protein PVAP13_3NG140894 [Panicum virgatum]|uniref:Uncharacterized protein n=1 Tax=Panicum virgatum TaxID=38727 RepID=A0A8T0U3V1_PANVG|nr:hypothetical protein PVAP13_3NG140894 [Panicum virgatum]